MKRPWPIAFGWVITLAVAVPLVGCSSIANLSVRGTATLSCGHPQAMLLIIGAHKDAPQPTLGPRLLCRVTAAIHAGKPVRIVVASGQPRTIDPRLLPVTGGTLAEQYSPRVRQDVQRVRAAVAAARPDSPGVNDLEALSVAADTARSLGDAHADLVLVDSGLDDRGALDFTVPGMVAAAPADVVNQLEASGNLPRLRGFTVLLVGLGYTAPPQAPLSAKWRGNVTGIWAAVVRSAGAKVEIIPQPGQGPSVTTDQPVARVPVPPTEQVTPKKRTTITFTEESPVRFEPNSTDFVDPAAALHALRPIARWLAAQRSRHAWLEGTTADVGPMSGQIALSRLRADRVRDALISLGASSAQISTKGVGSEFPQFTPDRSRTGVLLAGPAALNRSVRITLT
jgi:OmpA-OmpF porin, OOP family